MIFIETDYLRRIETAAEAAYPRECCGLLAGVGPIDGDITVTRLRASPNMAGAERPDRFEIDPKIRFELMRQIGEFERPDGDPGERIVGHYHSHPDHPARPSAHDLKMAFEPDLFWLILALEDGRAAALTIHRFDAAKQAFVQIDFTTEPLPKRTLQ